MVMDIIDIANKSLVNPISMSSDGVNTTSL